MIEKLEDVHARALIYNDGFDHGADDRAAWKQRAEFAEEETKRLEESRRYNIESLEMLTQAVASLIHRMPR